MKRMWDEEFWTDPTFGELSFDEMGLLFYLSCNLHTLPSGIYPISRRVMVFESRLSEKRLDAAMDGLTREGLVRYDEVKKVVWVTPFFKKNCCSWKFAVSAIDSLFSQGLGEWTELWIAENEKLLQADQSKDRISLRRSEVKHTVSLRYPIAAPPVQEKKRIEKNREKKKQASSDAKVVFELWKELFNHSRARFTDGRKKKIATRLNSFSVEELKQSLRGYASDPWRHGDGNGPPAIVRHELETLMRSDSHVERGMFLCSAEPQQNKSADPLLQLAEAEASKRGGL